MALSSGAHAAEDPSGPIISDASVLATGDDLDLVSGSNASSVIESDAVRQFNKADELFTEPSDVSVDTVDGPDGTKVVVVVPRTEIEVDRLRLATDSDSQELSLGAETKIADDQLVTTGPGLGSFPSWDNVTQYQVQLNVYFAGRFLGYGRFSTRFRNRVNDLGIRQYQYTRSARAQPAGSYAATGPDMSIHVKKLWISNRLTDATQAGAGQWDDRLTRPLAGESLCDSPGAEIGPWGVGISNCADTDVWQSKDNVGHMRVSMDQGYLTKPGARFISYVSGYTWRRNAPPPANTYYQFVTFTVGDTIPGVGMPGSYYSMKCSDDGRGASDTRKDVTCSS